MRIRTIKPEFWQNEFLAQLSEKARLLALALLNYADDEGYFYANPEVMRAQLFPFDRSSTATQTGLTELAKIDYVRVSQADDGRLYGFVVNFKRHQKISHASTSKLKGLASFTEASRNGQGVLPEDSLLEQGSGKGTGNRDQGGGDGTPPGSISQLPGIGRDSETVITELIGSGAYDGIDVRTEFKKWGVWCKNHKRKPTERRFIAWLNNIERPMAGGPVTVPGANKHQMPAATADDHGKGFLFGTGIAPREGGQL